MGPATAGRMGRSTGAGVGPAATPAALAPGPATRAVGLWPTAASGWSCSRTATWTGRATGPARGTAGRLTVEEQL